MSPQRRATSPRPTATATAPRHQANVFLAATSAKVDAQESGRRQACRVDFGLSHLASAQHNRHLASAPGQRIPHRHLNPPAGRACPAASAPPRPTSYASPGSSGTSYPCYFSAFHASGVSIARRTEAARERTSPLSSPRARTSGAAAGAPTMARAWATSLRTR
jgi:hypothetical protein